MLIALDSAKIISRYLASLTARKCAPTTLRTARWVLNHFAHTLGTSILDATPDDIDDWMAERATEVAGPTLRNQGSYLRGFFRWATAHDYIASDPSRRMVLPRATRRRLRRRVREVTEKRRPGRPEVGGRVVIRLDPEHLARVDAAAQLAEVTRAEMLRRMIDAALTGHRVTN